MTRHIFDKETSPIGRGKRLFVRENQDGDQLSVVVTKIEPSATRASVRLDRDEVADLRDGLTDWLEG